mgnify:CR=1 FL=1
MLAETVPLKLVFRDGAPRCTSLPYREAWLNEVARMSPSGHPLVDNHGAGLCQRHVAPRPQSLLTKRSTTNTNYNSAGRSGEDVRTFITRAFAKVVVMYRHKSSQLFRPLADVWTAKVVVTQGYQSPHMLVQPASVRATRVVMMYGHESSQPFVPPAGVQTAKVVMP